MGNQHDPIIRVTVDGTYDEVVDLSVLLECREENERLRKEALTWRTRFEAVCETRNALKAEVERLAKCCTQRGARMQIMRAFLDAPRGLGPPTEWWYFCEERPEAKSWFDEDGVPK